MEHAFIGFSASDGILIEQGLYGFDTDLFLIFNLIFRWLQI